MAHPTRPMRWRGGRSLTDDFGHPRRVIARSQDTALIARQVSFGSATFNLKALGLEMDSNGVIRPGGSEGSHPSDSDEEGEHDNIPIFDDLPVQGVEV